MAGQRTAPPPVTRPDGSLYRPRKLSAQPVGDPDWDLIGVVVLGTHDIAVAQPLADEFAAQEVGKGAKAVKPGRVWWRDAFEGGHRTWVTDEEHGRAGVHFSEIEEG